MFYREIKIKKSDSFDFLIPFSPPQLFFDIKMCHNLCFKCRLFLTLGKQGWFLKLRVLFCKTENILWILARQFVPTHSRISWIHHQGFSANMHIAFILYMSLWLGNLITFYSDWTWAEVWNCLRRKRFHVHNYQGFRMKGILKTCQEKLCRWKLYLLMKKNVSQP